MSRESNCQVREVVCQGIKGQVREVMCQGTQRPGNEGGVL